MKVVRSTISRQSGANILVIDNRDGSFESESGLEQRAPEGCEWVNVCDDHSTFICHSTRALAESFAASPAEWCEECRELAEPELMDRSISPRC